MRQSIHFLDVDICDEYLIVNLVISYYVGILILILNYFEIVFNGARFRRHNTGIR